MNLEIFLNQVCEIPNVFSRLKFIPCDHHDRNPSLLKSRNCLWNLVLELVFNGSRSQYVQFALGLFNEGNLHLFNFSRCFGFVKLIKGYAFFSLLEVFILFGRHFSVSKN